MSLFEELGINYSSDFFSGAMVRHKDRPCTIHYIEGDGTVVLRDWSAGGKEVRGSHEDFPSFASFQFPSLGYRQLHNINTLVYFERRPSVRRGLHPQDVRSTVHDVSRALADVLRNENNYGDLENLAYKVPSILTPTYTSFREGLPAILAGKIPFFVMSAEFAVAPHESIKGLEILYRRRRVGTIDDNGNITMNLSNPLINHLWNKEISRG